MVSLLMGASFLVSWLMPDFFTPIAILCMGYLLFGNHKPKIHVYITALLLVVSVAMHFSHSVVSLLVLFSLFICYLIKRYKIVLTSVGLSLKRMSLVFILIIMSIVISSCIQSYYSGKLKSSQSGMFFLIGNLVEMGIVDDYLDEACLSKNYKICQYKDSLQNNFIWASNSPHNLHGGWYNFNDEYNAIVKDIITTPKYLVRFAYKSIFLTIKQFFSFDMGDANKPTERVVSSIQFFYPGSYKYFIASKQYNEKNNYELTNYFQVIIFGCSLLIYIIVLLYKKMSDSIRVMMCFILSALIFNAFVCGTFSGVFPRYQDRLVWLLPLPIFIYIIDINCKKKNDFNK